jgi:hypothetical protein
MPLRIVERRDVAAVAPQDADERAEHAPDHRRGDSELAPQIALANLVVAVPLGAVDAE